MTHPHMRLPPLHRTAQVTHLLGSTSGVSRVADLAAGPTRHQRGRHVSPTTTQAEDLQADAQTVGLCLPLLSHAAPPRHLAATDGLGEV